MKTEPVKIRERVLSGVSPIKNGVLLLEWDNGASGVVDLRDFIARMPVFEFLRDDDAFNLVKIAEDGSAIFWTDYEGDVVDIDSDTLWLRRRPIPKFSPNNRNAIFS